MNLLSPACATDAQAIGFLVVAVVMGAILVGGGYLAGCADSRRGPAGSAAAEGDALPDPRRFRPPRKPGA